jgi:hypothetical protein
MDINSKYRGDRPLGSNPARLNENATSKFTRKPQPQGFYESSLKAKVESEAKAAEELKAKQEAVSAQAANQVKVITPSKVSSSKTVVPKKVTITCIKGKLVKKVTATNPKCPVGYKKK